jgi:hypothetical protein
MYIVVIGWLYVSMMMAVAEATNTTGTVLGAIVTFVLYGVLPVSLVVYLMATPARKKAIRAREAAEWEAQKAAAAAAGTPSDASDASDAPDAGSQPPADAVAPVRKEP